MDWTIHYADSRSYVQEIFPFLRHLNVVALFIRASNLDLL
jgi:hypothetical protein